jgi:lipoprotein NlpI
LDRASIWNSKGDNDRAIADCEQVIKLDPDNTSGYGALAWGMKGGLRFAKRDLERAISDYDEAIRLASERPSFYIDRGYVSTIKADYSRALADFDQAIKLDADNPLGHYSRGNAHRLKGDYERAIQDFSSAIRLDPTFALAFKNRGDTYRERGDYDLAAADYDQVISLAPNDVSALANRGLTRLYLGEYVKAADDLARSTQDSSNTFQIIWLYLSRIRAGDQAGREELAQRAGNLKKGDWPTPIVELFLDRQSIEATLKAAQNSEQRCEAQFYIAEWHLVRGARQSSLKALQTVANTCPKNFVEYQGAVAELKRLSAR